MDKGFLRMDFLKRDFLKRDYRVWIMEWILRMDYPTRDYRVRIMDSRRQIPDNILPEFGFPSMN
jgi:hypothetical protein